MFRRKLLSPSSGMKNKPRKSPARLCFPPASCFTDFQTIKMKAGYTSRNVGKLETDSGSRQRYMYICRFYCILTMVYTARNYWVFGLCPSSGILETRKHDVSEAGYVSFLRCGRKTPTQLGPLDRANLSHWLALPTGSKWVRVFPPLWGRKQIQLSKRLVF
jgi:hypothetical protein